MTTTAAGAPPLAHQLARLPGRLTPFVGRQADLGRLLALLKDPSVRLLTLSGIGGIGKTALALELASRMQDRFQQGAIFVSLAHLDSVEDLLPALAHALDVRLPPGGDLQQAMFDQLAAMHLLLVLDGFERLLDEAVLIRDLLLAAPRLKIFVTSREKLSLEAEMLYNLTGLELPASEDAQDARECDALRLFAQRARQANPAFSINKDNASAITRICRMVDGSPLGILLAASWAEHFSPAEIAQQAGSSLDFLARDLRDGDPRHSSLRLVFDWSFQRLDESHKAVFRRLSVFRGGFDLAAAQAVAGADLTSLIALVERSLLARLPESGRYELHGLLQQYAREALIAADRSERVLDAHAAYYCRFIKQREPRLVSGQQTAALDELQADLDNIRQAFSRLVEKRDFQSARLMLPGLYHFCDTRSRFYEGEAIFRQAAEWLAPLPGEKPDGAWALALLSWFDMEMYIEWLDSYEHVTSQARACLDQCLSAGDAQGAAASLDLLGAIAEHQRDFASAIGYCQEAVRLFPQMDNIYWVTMRIGLCYEADQQYGKAIESFQACLARTRRTGEIVAAAWALQNIGDCLALQGRPEEAENYLEQALPLFRQVGTPIGVLWSLHSLGRAAWALGKPERARALAQQAATLAPQVHSASWMKKTEDLLRKFNPEKFKPEMARKSEPPLHSLEEPLSEREHEVLGLLKSDLSGPEIARRLVVSLNTLRFHTKHIYQKLGVNTRLEAIHRAKGLDL